MQSSDLCRWSSGDFGGTASEMQRSAWESLLSGALLAEWYYTDPQKQQQGPFTLSQMRQWYAQGFLPDDTEAKHVDDAE